MKLFEILGRNMMSTEVTSILAAFPALKAEVQDLEEEGIPPVRYLTSERDGLLIKGTADGDIVGFFLMSEGKDGFSEYSGEMPSGLDFESTRADVLKRLGPPTFIQAPKRIGQLQTGELMRFDQPAYSLHFQFRADGSGIELITVMVASAVPGRSVAAPRG
jgi:hypothetical protein